ncbi:uncharacterized protein [Chironomus tepperi]|uniref:uncharacterized protein isoform X1 n=1 Tax=Chironomus tepperi TaxID=113505 RepID=UPI00391FC1EA
MEANGEQQRLLSINGHNSAAKQAEQVEMIELNSSTIITFESNAAIKTGSSLKDLTFIEDQSAQISEFLRKNESLKFWSSNKISVVMNYYITNTNACIKNLFSILMFDCYELSINSPDTYFLTEKFQFFESTGSKIYEKLFQKLLNVFDDAEYDKYHQLCLTIIYFLFNEVHSNIEDDVKHNYKNFRKVIVPELIQLTLKVKNVEYRTEILKLVTAFLDSTDEDNYIILKQNILKSIQHVAGPHQSACKSSYNEIIMHCDELYFNLLFLLIENLMMTFKFEYKVFIKTYQNYFGEYWIHAIKQNSQLLYIYADLQKLVDTKEFLLIITEGADLKSKIISTIKKVAEFQAVFVVPLDRKHEGLLIKMTNFIEKTLLDDDQDDNIITEFESMFRNAPKVRKLLFGRKDFKSESLFEEILSIPAKKDESWNYIFKEILHYIWNEFKLWEKPEILTAKNPKKKRLFDYVLQTDNDAFIILFSMPKIADKYEEICKPLLCMMLKNSLYYDFKSSRIDHDFVEVEDDYLNFGTNPKCLIEYHLNLIDKNERNDYENTKNLMYLLEEIYQFCPDQDGKNQFFVKLFKKILYEEPEVFNGKHELKLPRKHFWIGLMMIYWGYYVEFQHVEAASKENKTQKCFIILKSTSNPNEEILKLDGTFIPFLNLLSLIISNKDEDFYKEFPEEIKEMERSYKDLYQLPRNYDTSHQNTDKNEIFHFYEKYSTNFCFIFLYAAIKTNKKNIVKLIFDYNNFLINCPEFPANMIVSDIHHYTVQMFLENKYELGRGELPKNWIPHEVMEDFLDSRITCHNNFYKVNCNFMLPYFNHDKIPEKIDDGIMMSEDYDTMEYMLNDYELRSLVTHPVMEMIIRTKNEKYDRIFFWNLAMFILTYICPTIGLVCLLHSYDNFTVEFGSDVENGTSLNGNLTEDSNTTYVQKSSNWFDDLNLRFSILIILSIFRILPISIRELIQYSYVFKDEYFKKLTNLIEFGLIILPIIFLIPTVLYWIYESEWLFVTMVVIEAINVLLMIIATAFLYPVLKFAIYMKCFLTVFTTYVMIFLLFLPLFFGCVAMAFIIFDKKLGGKIEEFHGFGNASTKYIIMYAGELNIDSEKLTGFIQVIAITIIIILIINKVNLIISIVVNDVQRVLDQAKEFSLRLYAKKYVEFAKKIRIFYANIDSRDDNQNISNSTERLLKFIRLMTSKYPHLHQIHTLYVEKKTGYVHIVDRRPLFEVNYCFMRYLRKRKNWFVQAMIFYWDDFFSHLKLETETMNEIKAIVKKRKRAGKDLSDGQDDEN